MHLCLQDFEVYGFVVHTGAFSLAWLGIAAFRGRAQESSGFHLQPSFNYPDDNETLRPDASDT